jgi:AraC-like DNA-binding protein
MTKQPTVIASYVKTLTQTLSRLNIKYDTFVPAGWESTTTDCRIPLAQINAFWHTLITQHHDKSLGLKVALNVHNNSFHQLGLLARQCNDLGEIWDMAIKFYSLVSEAGTLSSENNQDNLVINFEPCDISPALTVQQIEGMMGAVFQYALCIMEGDFQLSSVDLKHSQTSSTALYHEVFNCPVNFNQPYYRLYIARKELLKPIPLASKAMKDLHLSATKSNMAKHLNFRQHENALHFDIYELLRSGLPNNIPTLEECAITLHTSSSTIKRKLKKSNFNYSDIADQVRKDIAFQLLIDQKISIKDIAYRAGFNCPTNFYRSFKKWSDLTPVEYRKKYRHLNYKDNILASSTISSINQ